MKKYAIMDVFPCSSMVEQEAVNFEVASSSLAGGAIFLFHKKLKKRDIGASRASLAGGH